jgi:hypothetical protein
LSDGGAFFPISSSITFDCAMLVIDRAKIREVVLRDALWETDPASGSDFFFALIRGAVSWKDRALTLAEFTADFHRNRKPPFS